MQVPLGILPLNENKGDEMVQIMSHLHQYVPSYEYNVSTFIPSINETVVETKAVVKTTLFGGDQLTSSRGKGALKARVNADSPSSRFDGLLPVMEDWHTKVLFLGVSYNINFECELLLSLHLGSISTLCSLPVTMVHYIS